MEDYEIESTKNIFKNSEIGRNIPIFILGSNRGLNAKLPLNILYKNSGEERYPEFKLYKMIARTIHGAIPSKQLGHALFKNYIVVKKTINRNHKIINIDKIPVLC